MNILVCISKTPDTTSKIAFNGDATAFIEDGVQFIMNPYDEWYALVRAIELKEQSGGTVTVINVGPASNDIIIRKALAIGADQAVRIDGEAPDTTYVGKQIAQYCSGKSFDIILLGKETIDFNGSALGSYLSGLLDVPFISYASKLDMDGSSAIIHCEYEGGTRIVKVQTPFIVSAAKGLAEQRIPNMKGIMDAKKKPLDVVPAQDVKPSNIVKAFSLPKAKTGVKMIDPENMEELVRLLHEEAKAI